MDQDATFMAYYVPVAQDQNRPIQALYVRANGDARDVLGAVTAYLRGFSPEVRYATTQTLRDYVDPAARSWKLGASLFSVFGLLALIVAAVGLYSLLAFDVAQRTREIGIRSALGAEKRRLLAGVVMRGARLAGMGVALGLAVTWFAAPRIADLLFEVSPREPAVLAGVAALLLLVSIAASLAPGLRATRVDPMEALRSE
jgi:ABC-type antimicrobial peptide transport system permease subunit